MAILELPHIAAQRLSMRSVAKSKQISGSFAEPVACRLTPSRGGAAVATNGAAAAADFVTVICRVPPSKYLVTVS